MCLNRYAPIHLRRETCRQCGLTSFSRRRRLKNSSPTNRIVRPETGSDFAPTRRRSGSYGLTDSAFSTILRSRRIPPLHSRRGVPSVKTIPVSKRSRVINVLLKRARRENVILRSADGKEFLLAGLDDFDREIELARGNKALMRLLDARARQSQALSLGTVKTQLRIGTTRRRPARRRI